MDPIIHRAPADSMVVHILDPLNKHGSTTDDMHIGHTSYMPCTYMHVISEILYALESVSTLQANIYFTRKLSLQEHDFGKCRATRGSIKI